MGESSVNITVTRGTTHYIFDEPAVIKGKSPKAPESAAGSKSSFEKSTTHAEWKAFETTGSMQGLKSGTLVVQRTHIYGEERAALLEKYGVTEKDLLDRNVLSSKISDPKKMAAFRAEYQQIRQSYLFDIGLVSKPLGEESTTR